MTKHRRRKTIMTGIALSSGFVLGVMSILYIQGYIRPNNPDASSFPIRGIDISHHQGQIDWERLSQENVTFVYMKATEGGDFHDSQFMNNWKNSKEAGLIRGAYHFFTFCKNGKEQAANFIQHVPKEPLTLPPVIDFEYSGNCQAKPKKDMLLKELRDYIVEIEATYNSSPIVYVTYKAYKDYLQSELEGYQLWIRDIWKRPSLGNGKSWTFWQYADRGRLHGINGPVDLNVFNGTRDEFNALLHNSH